MRVVTWNLWHGLSPTEKWWFEELEPQGRRELRHDLQEQVLKDLNADIYLFQEVNPVRSRSKRLAKALQCEEIHQADSKGLKLLSIGFPLNLNSGLSILHSKKLKCLNIQVTNLSGNTTILNDWGSLQLAENRVLLVATFEDRDSGKIVSVANTHFHHGVEFTDKLKDSFNEIHGEVRGELFQRLSAGDERRTQELDVALSELKRIKKKSDLFIFAGDFNFSPDTKNYQTLLGSGYVDLWKKLRPSDEGATFDHTKNTSNHRFLENFRLPLEVNDLTFQAEVKDFLTKTIRDSDHRPRRIDYVWTSEDSAAAAEKIDLFGFENAQGLAPSDHFGLVADFNLEVLE